MNFIRSCQATNAGVVILALANSEQVLLKRLAHSSTYNNGNADVSPTSSLKRTERSRSVASYYYNSSLDSAAVKVCLTLNMKHFLKHY